MSFLGQLHAGYWLLLSCAELPLVLRLELEVCRALILPATARSCTQKAALDLRQGALLSQGAKLLCSHGRAARAGS